MTSFNSRLPMLGDGGESMQVLNDPNGFRFQEPSDQVFERVNEEEEGFNFEASGVYNRNSVGARDLGQSPTKTAGQVSLKELQAEDVANEPYIGRDAINVIEGEMRQFDRPRHDVVQKYVESLVTGQFMRVQKDINLQVMEQQVDEKNKKLKSNREFFDKEMKEIQRIWVNRVNKLFNLFLGILAGMSAMHLIVLLNQSDQTSFISLYAQISQTINIVFMIFTSFDLIFGLALTMIYKQKSDEKMRNMDIFRMEFRQHFVVSLVITILIAFCLIMLYILPVWTNKLNFWNPSNITSQDVLITKGLFAATNVIFIISWLLASAFNKASISDMDLDPEEDDEELENMSTDGTF